MIELEQVYKYFPSNGVTAVQDVSLLLRKGEIHALVGENGAGKSTLMHILAGVLTPSAGEIRLDGKPRHFSSPADALEAGIGMVMQHPVLVPGISIWEYCVLGAEPGRPLFLDRKKGIRQVQALSDRWDFALDVRWKTDGLTISQRQKTALLALLWHQTRYLILDEPTAVLSVRETEQLFKLLRKLREEGMGIVFISHKIQEVLTVADRISILRKGRLVGSYAAYDYPEETLFSLIMEAMVGKGVQKNLSIADGEKKSYYIPPLPVQNETSPLLLEVQHVEVHSEGYASLWDLSFSARSGEIVGITGVREGGLETLEHVLAGFIKPVRGTLRFAGQDLVNPGGPLRVRALGGIYVASERWGVAMAPHLSLWDSLVIHAHRRYIRPFLKPLQILDLRALNGWVKRIMEQAHVTGSPYHLTSSFSGGQLQRLLLHRELQEPCLWGILSEPFRGLDFENQAVLIELLKSLARRGILLIVIGTDLDLLFSLCTRILVVSHGRISLDRPLPATEPPKAPQGEGEVYEQIVYAMNG
ncbi:MAG: ATP-binding cassette domain-containing protein [Treponemataceae bacterium]|nr:ATP-binding cassette domain-containing protein [Treponemataceae bacterium]